MKNVLLVVEFIGFYSYKNIKNASESEGWRGWRIIRVQISLSSDLYSLQWGGVTLI